MRCREGNRWRAGIPRVRRERDDLRLLPEASQDVGLTDDEDVIHGGSRMGPPKGVEFQLRERLLGRVEARGRRKRTQPTNVCFWPKADVRKASGRLILVQASIHARKQLWQ